MTLAPSIDQISIPHFLTASPLEPHKPCSQQLGSAKLFTAKMWKAQPSTYRAFLMKVKKWILWAGAHIYVPHCYYVCHEMFLKLCRFAIVVIYGQPKDFLISLVHLNAHPVRVQFICKRESRVVCPLQTPGEKKNQIKQPESHIKAYT